MNLNEIAVGGGVLIVLMTLVQITPIKVNPWSAIRKALVGVGRELGRVLNGDVLQKLDELEVTQTTTRTLLDEHIRVDDERNADMHRARILQFNTELLRRIRHTEEDFNEILYNIDCYEKYCVEHPEYQNNRAVHAIKNIDRVYDECMKNNDFL